MNTKLKHIGSDIYVYIYNDWYTVWLISYKMPIEIHAKQWMHLVEIPGS